MIFLIYHKKDGQAFRSVVEAVTEEGAMAAFTAGFPEHEVARVEERALAAPRILETIPWPFEV